jgi:hypothetical protein
MIGNYNHNVFLTAHFLRSLNWMQVIQIGVGRHEDGCRADGYRARTYYWQESYSSRTRAVTGSILMAVRMLLAAFKSLKVLDVTCL